MHSRWIIIGLALAAAAALAFAVGSPVAARWWSVGDILAVGPNGTSACFGGECTTHELVWLGGGALFRQAALATLAAGMLDALLLVALAAARASKRRGTLLAGSVLTATGTAAIAAIVFVATFPGVGALGPGHEASLGLGGLVFALGVVLAAAASVSVMRQQDPAR
jgi:hypothetical protein